MRVSWKSVYLTTKLSRHKPSCITDLSPFDPAPAELSVIARQCVAAICLRRFCERYGIVHDHIDAFVEHLWGVAVVKPESFEVWELGFQTLPAAGWGEPLPPELLEIIPPTVRADYERLANAVIECSAATWYAGDIPATLCAFEDVASVMRAHGIPLPRLEPFQSSSPAVFDGWGSRPSPGELAAWRVQDSPVPPAA